MAIDGEPNIEEVALTQRATDPRLEQQVQDPTSETPEIEESSEVQPEPEPTESIVKPRKSAEEVLKGRVGHLTKTLSAKDQAIAAKEQELADAKSRLAAAEALLNSNGQTPVSLEPTTPQKQPQTYTQEDFEAAVARQTEVQEFNRKADEMYSDGAAKFQDWKDSVDTLVASGFMTKDLLDAAMAIEDGTSVLHHLGSNLDEAERINALPPIKKAAEMAKLSSVLNTPRSAPVSSAPSPIKPVSGSPSPQLDLQRISDTEDMRAYIAARAKQGARWAHPGGTR